MKQFSLKAEKNKHYSGVQYNGISILSGFGNVRFQWFLSVLLAALSHPLYTELKMKTNKEAGNVIDRL